MAKKLVPTVAVTVIRDGKRVTRTPAMGAFSFTQDEIDSIKKVMPTAFRQPVNEDPEPTDETAPEGEAGATANDTPKTPAKKKAAQASSTSKVATKDGEAAPKSTKAADQADDSDAEDAADDADEDEDI